MNYYAKIRELIRGQFGWEWGGGASGGRGVRCEEREVGGKPGARADR